MIANLVQLCYIIAAALFVFALKWMSSADTSRRGVIAGEVGMALAIIGTLVGHEAGFQYREILIAFAIGSAVGVPLAYLMPMTAVPQRTALSHAFGAKPVALTMAFATAAIFLLYPAFPTLAAWFPLRLLQGITVATLFALSEAWVLTNAKGSLRGLIVGIYATCISATFGVGAGVIGWVGIEGYLPFVIGAVVLVLAALPMSALDTSRRRRTFPSAGSSRGTLTSSYPASSDGSSAGMSRSRAGSCWARPLSRPCVSSSKGGRGSRLR